MIWVIKRALLPIKALAVSAKRVGTEREFLDMPLKGPSEIIPTIMAFNTMQSQLSSFIDDRTKMLAAISHDLRTPITSLRLRLEFIEEGQDKQQMLATVSQMEAMIKSTLNFAKEDAQKEAKQNVEIVSLLESIIDDYRAQGADIELTSPDKLVFRLWPSAIRRVIENLINNSLRYGTGSDGNVNIIVECLQTQDHLIIKILDQGKGIEEGSLAEVMKPFVRLDKARDTSESSVGLGLAISQSIIQSHGGTLLLSNNKTGGLCVEISLPCMSNK
jgi:signal transduction histidine kinase